MRANTVGITIFCATAALAQENAPPGFLRGDLIAWTGTPRDGQFTFRTADRVYSCSYDQNTYFELDNQRITLERAAAGDRFELISDEQSESHACYARTVHIVDPQPAYIVPGVRPTAGRMEKSRNIDAENILFPADPSVSLSGVVIRIAAGSLTLRTRSGERNVVRLRPDTRYMTAGQTTELSSLGMNTIVFIRGSRNFENEVEAYQVIWGEIFQPQQ